MVVPFTRITADPRVCGGQPCIRGLRIPVALVLRHLAAEQTAQQIVEEYPELELGDVLDCLRYAAWLASGRTIDLAPAALRAEGFAAVRVNLRASGRPHQP